MKFLPIVKMYFKICIYCVRNICLPKALTSYILMGISPNCNFVQYPLNRQILTKKYIMYEKGKWVIFYDDFFYDKIKKTLKIPSAKKKYIPQIINFLNNILSL